jgi:hypothetical protein
MICKSVLESVVGHLVGYADDVLVSLLLLFKQMLRPMRSCDFKHDGICRLENMRKWEDSSGLCTVVDATSLSSPGAGVETPAA